MSEEAETPWQSMSQEMADFLYLDRGDPAREEMRQAALLRGRKKAVVVRRKERAEYLKNRKYRVSDESIRIASQNTALRTKECELFDYLRVRKIPTARRIPFSNRFIDDEEYGLERWAEEVAMADWIMMPSEYFLGKPIKNTEHE